MENTVVKKKFTIGLNMIVKNESNIIENTLEILCSKINFDYWVICDTGSTDNTKEIIQQFFDKKNILGELIEEKWFDFGYNRTFALENAYNKTDYLLIFDADDTIVGDIIFPDNFLNYDSYYLTFSSSNCCYKRILLINNRKKWKFVGVLHEYIECLETSSSTLLEGNYYVISGRNGNRNKNVEKYKNDALILEKAYDIAIKNNDPIHMRYSFYCANSYKDTNDNLNAIKWYKNTLTLNNWGQEKYVSCLRLYEMYEQQNNIETAMYYLIESYKYDTTRIECFFKIIKYYCINKLDIIAYKFYELIQNYYENDYINDNFKHKLFVYENDYSFYLPYYMIIVCSRLQKYNIGLKMFDIIFTKKNMNISEWYIKNLVYNLQFFIEKNTNIEFVNKWREYLLLINEKNYDIDKKLVNKYEIYNISNFITTYLPEKNLSDNNNTITNENIVIAILAKDKEIVLPFYLECIYNQTYNKKYIHLYIRTNDNKDNTNIILQNFIKKYGDEYASVYFDDSSISELLKQYSIHEWNTFRFNILGKIRQESINYAYKLNANYFVANCDNFVIPTTIENMMKNKDAGVIAPMLKYKFYKKDNNNNYYSNYHYDVFEDGFYKRNNKYFSILNYEITGLFRSCCVNCSYYIPYKYLPFINYNDDSNRYEYIIFSDVLRKCNIPQYIDNTNKYGYLTFAETKEDFEYNFEDEKKLYDFSNNILDLNNTIL